MKIRGERECKDCGTRWSYYDSESVVCPDCGSMRSVGVDERREHTAAAVELELTPVRDLVDDAPLEEVAERAAEVTREYVRKSGFLNAGELQELDDTYLAAVELREVAEGVARSMRVSDDEEYYFLSLLGGADGGERPPADEVPESMRAARGLAYAKAVDEYASDSRRYLDDNPNQAAGRILSTLGEHRKRIAALDGDVSPRTAGSLIYIARALGRALAENDETALAEAQQRLDEFEVGL